MTVKRYFFHHTGINSSVAGLTLRGYVWFGRGSNRENKSI